MKNAILTGCSGFIGRHMIKLLIENHYEVYAVIRNFSKASQIEENPHVHVIETDLKNLSAAHFPCLKYDFFLHMGWGGVNREEIDNESIHLQNYDTSIRCLNVANTLKCEVFADTGSRAEYGINCQYCNEDIIGEPTNAYGYYKKKFYEHAVKECCKLNLEYIHFRLFSVIGIDDHPWSLVSMACKNFKSNREMNFGACNQLWNFMSVDDACRAMLTVIKNYDRIPAFDNRIINIASSDTRILKDYIQTIYKLSNSNSKMKFDNTKKGYNTCPSTKKLQEYFDWKDRITFENEIINILSSVEYNE